jgi:D-tyrosyl-tRNA(Tyr) deacylase
LKHSQSSRPQQPLHDQQPEKLSKIVDTAQPDTGAPLLVISQFTLYADTRKGRRPSWQGAAPGPVAEPLVDAVVSSLRALGARVETGVFGTDMEVSVVNDGPVASVSDLAWVRWRSHVFSSGLTAVPAASTAGPGR